MPEVPELESADDESPDPPRFRRRAARWFIIIAACAVVLGLVVSLTGVWRAFEPAPQLEPLSDISLELPDEVPAGNDFGAQQPNWQDCGTNTSTETMCADVRAPLDWGNPGGDTITLRLAKHLATSGNPIGTLFVNRGGPGATDAEYIRLSINSAVGTAIQRDYDVIGWDPRGVGTSSAVDCFDDAELDDYLFGLDDRADAPKRGTDAWIAEATEKSTEFGAACEAETGPLLGHVDTESTVADLEMLRAIVGDAKLNYLGYSYGTVIGARYADAYPDTVGRLVLDGVLSPTASYDEAVRVQTIGFEQSLRVYTEWCLGERDCPIAPASGARQTDPAAVDGAMAQIGALLEGVDADPLTGTDGRMVGSTTLVTAIITPLYVESRWPQLSQLLASVADGNADVALALADSYYGRVDGAYVDNSTEAFQAINCLDYPNDPDPARMRAAAAELAKLAPTIGKYQGYGDLSCSGWPYSGPDERTPVTAPGADPILVVGTTGDPATPYTWSVDLAAQLDRGVLLTYEGEGHTAYGKNDCVNRSVEQYLLEGVLPKNGFVCS